MKKNKYNLRSLKRTMKWLFVAFFTLHSSLFMLSCSEDDPFFSASENDAPRFMNTDFPDGKKGVAPVLVSIDRTQNFSFEVIVTPVDYTTVTWFIDDEQVAEGLSVSMPLLAGNHKLKIVATTTKGRQTSRDFVVEVRPLAGDPQLADDAKSRWLTIGKTHTIECSNVTSVSKVYIHHKEATNVSYANGRLTFDVPDLTEGEYMLTLEDADGARYGCGWVTVSNNAYVDPGIKETVLWSGDVDINWGASNVTITKEALENVPVGATIRLEYERVDMPDGYHALRITTPWWGDNPEDQVVAQFDLTDDTPNPFEFTYTEANKAIVDERDGMLIVGYGYKLTKVVAVEGVAPVEAELWSGDVEVNWGASNVLITPDVMEAASVGSTICVYYEMVDMPDGYHALRITTPWWGDNAEDQVVAQFDLTADTPNPFEFTYTEANKAIVDERDGMLLVGYGYKITKVTVK